MTRKPVEKMWDKASALASGNRLRVSPQLNPKFEGAVHVTPSGSTY